VSVTCIYICMILYLDAEVTTDEVLMLKGSLSPYLDTHNEEESSYVTLSNGPYAYVADSTSTEYNSYNHVLVDVYFVTPILCKHCEDYIWGTGKVGVKCKDILHILYDSYVLMICTIDSKIDYIFPRQKVVFSKYYEIHVIDIAYMSK
ncbi:Protein kinase C, partial [Atta colombica]